MVMDLDNKLSKQVEAICAERGVRLTAQRKRVFDLICASKKASSAYELLEDLKKSEPQAKPPTVYRALDFLLEQGFIHRVESTNSFISCCSCNAHKHFSQLLICDQCGNVVELQNDNLIAMLANNAEKHGFTITNHVIESHGICQSCSQN
ncbi:MULTISPECIES: zinc uptake transcriptional repressor Zur [unclassified Vibrio]|uniref:zinc uptake transcriptional repressor Zur n=1 Tax=unclassified Vibrio TaxID=2614977 RepID=UPI001382955F|nr:MULTISPECIES: zinc uptake transcriptional repressor Zur [unclassified Vibrio]NAW70710.1 zinc uptake transcriptional repressor Zur [Vibrio sp. V28_P6S34P95]NAX06153.1 zinc uptake transcriptional repressor Zur [Vibrio sp. V30_P3S12P165]NAX33869.1 zinc uptake transcriptional repressor Zur [Vibrio sp. V29_P1S30P107]NAX36845.1 zinc uptake transcriptional repressor Zur [Vibrio sp. V27_P1S3P104]NAX41793.1 zinc uptake transcriptional repressor Zur [Vibrio sp. V26_P1S5P106]